MSVCPSICLPVCVIIARFRYLELAITFNIPLIISYLTLVVPYVRIGIVVVFITQWCEFLLELVKIFNYAKDCNDASEARSGSWEGGLGAV